MGIIPPWAARRHSAHCGIGEGRRAERVNLPARERRLSRLALWFARSIRGARRESSRRRRVGSERWSISCRARGGDRRAIVRRVRIARAAEAAGQVVLSVSVSRAVPGRRLCAGRQVRHSCRLLGLPRRNLGWWYGRIGGGSGHWGPRANRNLGGRRRDTRRTGSLRRGRRQGFSAPSRSR